MESHNKSLKIILEKVISEISSNEVRVGVSNRHIHIKREDLDILFGKGYELRSFRPLTQPGHYAAEEKLDIKGSKGTIVGVRILGPIRKYTQVEVAVSDTYKLGVKPMVRQSSDIEGTASVELIGPKGSLVIKEGVIVAKRHIHMPEYIAYSRGYKDGDEVDVETRGDRKTIFCKVTIRTGKNVVKELHLDTDEANAAGIKNGDSLSIIN